jgi:CheY-like chemotaxis protein
LVDDDEDDRYFMNEAFKEIGYATEVKKFITGKDLLHYLKQIDQSLYPSLIVLDDQLPGLDAGDILSILKANPMYQHIPVIVYSGIVSPSRKIRLLDHGAYAYIEKVSLIVIRFTLPAN